MGEVNELDSSVRGAAVHRASRLCAAARPDHILASRAALEAAGLPATGLQTMELKGIKDRVEAGEVRWDG